MPTCYGFLSDGASPVFSEHAHLNHHPDHIGFSGEETERLSVLTAALQDRMEGALDPRLIVLAGLEEADRADALSEEEREFLTSGRERLAAARIAHPGIDAAIAAVDREARAFDECWSEMRMQDRPGRPRRTAPLLRWPARIGLSAAAAVLLVVMVFSVFDGLRRTTITAPVAGHRIVQLEDGSTVRLAPGSSVSYVPGAAFDRMVRLSGSAFFSVEPDARRFTVETPTALTTVLGTRFGVAGSDQATEVTLVSGSVAVAARLSSSQVVVLEPGQKTIVEAGSPPSAPAAVNVAAALGWSDLLIFRETTMGQVVRTLEDVRGERVELGPGLAALAVTGTFGPEQSTAQVLEILAATLQARVETTAEGYRLRLD